MLGRGRTTDTRHDGPGSEHLVIVVDDEPAMLRVWRRVLRRLPVRVECYRRAHAAMDRILSESPALVVSDHQMPGMSGLDLLENVREARPTLDLLLFTSDEAARERASRRGFRAIDKATPPEEWMPTVLALIENRVRATSR